MKLTSIKLTPKEARGDFDGPPATIAGGKYKGPQYPYGMELRLDTDTLEKLGLDLSKFAVGETCVIEAKATVTRISESQMQGGTERRDLELQITDVAIEPDKAEKKAKVREKHLDSITRPTAEAAEEY